MVREELVKTIERVLPGISKKNIVEEFGQIVVCDGMMVAYNDDIGISYPINTDIEFSVDALDFYTAVKKMRNKELDLSVDESNLIISAGKTIIKLPSMSENVTVKALIEALDLDDKKFVPLNKNFIAGIKIMSNVASDNVDHPMGLYSLCISGEFIYAGDKAKVGVYHLKGDTTETMFIHNSHIKPIVGFNPDSSTSDGNWVYFINSDDAILACRQPNVSHIFPIESIEQNVENRGDETISLESVITEEMDIFIHFNQTATTSKFVRVTVGTDFVSIRSDSEKGQIHKEYSIKKREGQDMEFAINPVYLQQLIRNSPEFSFNKKTLYVENDNHKFAIALMMDD